MAGSIWGEVFRVSTWGESHGEGVGVVVDGAPAGISLSEEDIQKCLDRRKPGETKYSTPRKEGDKVKIMSGVFEGKTTGTPISMVVVNTSQKSGDYSNIANVLRLMPSTDSAITEAVDVPPGVRLLAAWQPVLLL